MAQSLHSLIFWNSRKTDQSLPPREELLNSARGGFAATQYDSANLRKGEFCLDTKLPGNNNAGHLYGTDLDQAEKADLLAYLLTKVLA